MGSRLLIALSAAFLLAVADIGQSWTSVAIHSDCDAVRVQACRGHFGMSIDPQGNYLIGPTPSGEQLSGRLTPAEQAQLTIDLASVMGQDTGQASCVTPHAESAIRTVIDLALTSGSIDQVYGTSSDGVCTRGGQSNAEVLNNDFQILLRKYYPNPFPH